MLSCNLLEAVGQRISRKIYDLLLKVGDYDRNLVDECPSVSEIESLGLKVGKFKPQESQKIRSFHQQEEEWSDVLKFPVAACYTYFKTLIFTDELLTESLSLEQEILNDRSDSRDGFNSSHDRELLDTKKLIVNLSKWLENIFEPTWQQPELSLAVRGYHVVDRIEQQEFSREQIATLIDKLSPQYDEYQRHTAAKELGKITSGKESAIQALTELLDTTENEETLWTAIESLYKLDRLNSAMGVRRVKKLDLDISAADESLALECRLIRKSNCKRRILFRVYCQGKRSCLPPNLKLILLNESGQTLHQAIASQSDLYVQLRFNGEVGDRFSIKVACEDVSVTEDFVM